MMMMMMIIIIIIIIDKSAKVQKLQSMFITKETTKTANKAMTKIVQDKDHNLSETTSFMQQQLLLRTK
jgi:hypothetical protein